MQSPSAADHILSSFELISPRLTDLMERFYTRLFEHAPQVRPLFPQDLTRQKTHLAAAVGLVVKNVDDLTALERPLQEMGARHVRYGAQPAHYGVVRDQMLAAMADIAGPAWTIQFQRAWTEALDSVAAAMLRGAQAAPAGA